VVPQPPEGQGKGKDRKRRKEIALSELHDLSALAQSAAIKARQFSCLELTEHYLNRIDEHGSKVGAFITVLADEASQQANALDKRLADELDSASLSPLFGTCAPVKDLDLLAGVRCTFGSKVFAQYVAEDDATFVTRMKTAGLVISGKTNTPEFGFPCYTENQLVPPARTPWDLERSAGGSSGGAAAAVCAGLASIAQGSDGGGSIRIPASVTGLVGIKPARGRVTFAPLTQAPGELAVLGPLARTVADAAALLDVMAGPGLGDSMAPPPTPKSTFLAAANRDPGRLRIGRFNQPIIADTKVHPDVLKVYEETSKLLAELGHEIIDIERPYGPEVVPRFEELWSVGAASISVPPESEHLLMPLTSYLRQRGRDVSGAQLAGAITTMRMLSRDAITATDPYDVVLTPTLAKLPSFVGGLRDDADPAADFQAEKEFTPFTSPFNVSGQPAMSLPVGTSEAGLPIGVQIVGRPNDEVTLISLAAQLEAQVQWQDRKPPIWD
jgi:amidase